jgi:hypothetical protein
VDFASFFKGVARVGKTFEIHVGPIHARGVPAILVGVTGIVIAGGIAGALVRSAPMLPETFREANGLAKTLRGEQQRLIP